ncbi:MAG: hypothetical protein KDK34_00515, partial [Leptospiraceae bacterium]|nr:hypothetical protein [Leptospiraceae bacterium]
MKRRSILHACLINVFNALPVLIVVMALHCGPGQPDYAGVDSGKISEAGNTGSIGNPNALEIQYHLDESGRQDFED